MRETDGLFRSVSGSLEQSALKGQALWRFGGEMGKTPPLCSCFMVNCAGHWVHAASASRPSTAQPIESLRLHKGLVPQRFGRLGLVIAAPELGLPGLVNP